MVRGSCRPSNGAASQQDFLSFMMFHVFTGADWCCRTGDGRPKPMSFSAAERRERAAAAAERRSQPSQPSTASPQTMASHSTGVHGLGLCLPTLPAIVQEAQQGSPWRWSQGWIHWFTWCIAFSWDMATSLSTMRTRENLRRSAKHQNSDVASKWSRRWHVLGYHVIKLENWPFHELHCIIRGTRRPSQVALRSWQQAGNPGSLCVRLGEMLLGIFLLCSCSI